MIETRECATGEFIDINTKKPLASLPFIPSDADITSTLPPRGAQRFNKEKRKWGLVDFKALEPMVEVLEYGAHKYSWFLPLGSTSGVAISGKDIPMDQANNYTLVRSGANNWKEGGGIDKRETLESMMRHLAALLDGETIDPESGKPHIGHIGCNFMFYSHLEQKSNESGEEGKQTG